jgi:hypothetical protein
VEGPRQGTEGGARWSALPRFALIDDTVLDEEDPETRDLEEAMRWTTTYAQLLVLAVRLQADRPSEIESLGRQAEMYARRLQLWKERSQAIADRYP